MLKWDKNWWRKFDTDALFILLFYPLSFAQVESAQVICPIQIANAKAGATIIIPFYVYKFIKQTNVSKQRRQRNKHGRTNVDSTYKRSWNEISSVIGTSNQNIHDHIIRMKRTDFCVLIAEWGNQTCGIRNQQTALNRILTVHLVHLYYYYSFMLIWIGWFEFPCLLIRQV